MIVYQSYKEQLEDLIRQANSSVLNCNNLILEYNEETKNEYFCISLKVYDELRVLTDCISSYPIHNIPEDRIEEYFHNYREGLYRRVLLDLIRY